MASNKYKKRRIGFVILLLLLLLTFEASLGAMWFGFHVALKQDSRQLNRRLRQYQNRV